MVSLPLIWSALWYLPLGLLPLSISIGICWYLRRVRATVRTIVASPHMVCMMPRYSWMRLVVRMLCTVLAVWSLWIALLRPQIPFAGETLRYEHSRDIIIAVDISRSMLVEDCGSISRLQKAKDKIAALVGSLQSERVALIVFSDVATTLCPLTRDFAAFRMFLDMLDASTLSGTGSTSIASALSLAAQLCAKDADSPSKILLLFTDGEDFCGAVDEAQAQASRAGLLVSIMGMGSAVGGPIPLSDTAGTIIGHQRNADGGVVISRCDVVRLAAIAERCRGIYHTVCNDTDTDVMGIVSWVKAQEEYSSASISSGEHIDLCSWFTGLSGCLLLLAWVV